MFLLFNEKKILGPAAHFDLSRIPGNVLNRAKRLNGWNDWNVWNSPQDALAIGTTGTF
jgi:hypothetical protein